MKNRLDKLRAEFESLKIEGLFVQKPENRFYLSGFTGSAGILLITSSEAILFTDFRYEEQALKQAPDFKVVKYEYPIYDTLREWLTKLQINNLGFEDEFLTYAQFKALERELKDVTFLPLGDIFTNQRIIKEDKEIESLKQAVKLSDEAFSNILNYLKPGVTEKEIALELEFFMRQRGATKVAFDIIIASGVRSSLPHGIASEKKLEIGDFVTMDLGAVFQGYHSDLTRTVVLGRISEEQKKIYNIVLKAQREALNKIKAGLLAKDVDKVARDIIENHGYGENFGHGLGHGVGLEIHEKPSLSPKEERVLEAGMAVTIEPGIYIPNWGGVRIEDTVVVTKEGCNILTNSTKELLII